MERSQPSHLTRLIFSPLIPAVMLLMPGQRGCRVDCPIIGASNSIDSINSIVIQPSFPGGVSAISEVLRM
jgi:hypothetical protein